MLAEKPSPRPGSEVSAAQVRRRRLCRRWRSGAPARQSLAAVLALLAAAAAGEAHAAGEGLTCLGPIDPATGKPITIELKAEIGVPLDDTGIADQRLVNPRRPLPILQLVSGDEYPDIWRVCGPSVRALKIVLINRTERSFGLQFNLIVPDAKAEAGAAYRNLLVQVERKPGADPAAYDEVLQALHRSSSEPQSCQGAIARLDAAPSRPQVTDLKQYCLADVKSLLDRAMPRPATPKPPPDAATSALLEAMDEMSSAIDRVERSLDSAVSLPPGDCKYDTATSALRCYVKIIVPPGGRVPVPQAIMTYPPQNGLLTFTASFADTADIPSNSTGYLQMAREVVEAPDSTQWRYSAQLGASWDPDTGKAAEMKTFFPDQPYAGDTLQHFVGAGNLKISQRLGNRASASATLGFKKGDLGEKDTTRQVTVPEYALNLYGEGGEQLLFGKYTLAAPSSGIAVNVVGEGFELRNGTFSIGHLIQRESATGEADRSNRDNRLFIAQMKNRPFFKDGQPFFRTLTLVGLYGSEGAARLTVPNSSSNPLPDDPACEDPAPATGTTPATRQLCYGYRYWTGGFELSFAHEAPPEQSPSTFYPWSVSGTFSGYYSGRDLNKSAVNHIADRVKDGRGGTGLANVNFIRFRRTHDHQEGLEQEYLVGLLVGYGTGNSAADRRVDRGYLGESTAFTPDQIFLSRLAGHLTDRAASASGPQPLSLVQPGLSNKLYEGVTFTYNHPPPSSEGFSSPLWYLVDFLFRGRTEPVSQLSTVRIHNYSFNEPVFGRREAGTELDLELSMEVPKGITTTIDFGKFLAGSALRPVISKDPWLATATIKVDL